jgi:hypothetical protein
VPTLCSPRCQLPPRAHGRRPRLGAYGATHPSLQPSACQRTLPVAVSYTATLPLGVPTARLLVDARPPLRALADAACEGEHRAVGRQQVLARRTGREDSPTSLTRSHLALQPCQALRPIGEVAIRQACPASLASRNRC